MARSVPVGHIRWSALKVGVELRHEGIDVAADEWVNAVLFGLEEEAPYFCE